MTYHNTIHFFADIMFGGPQINIIDISTGEVRSEDRPTAFDIIAEKFRNGEHIILSKAV